MAKNVKPINLEEHPELFAHLANTVDTIEFCCDLTVAPRNDGDRAFVQKLKEGLAAGLFYEARPNVYKFTEQGIKNFKENAQAKG
jgi:hypothetical protein